MGNVVIFIIVKPVIVLFLCLLKPLLGGDHRYIQVLWALEIAETHAGRAHSAAFDHCSADLQVK